MLQNYINNIYKKYNLYARKEFWDLTADEIKEISNGCGAANAAVDYVPDSIYGLKISVACDIHDFDYYTGGSKEDKILSDLMLLINILLIIKQHRGNKFIQTLRFSRAIKYFFMVDFFGEDAFNFTG